MRLDRLPAAMALAGALIVASCASPPDLGAVIAGLSDDVEDLIGGENRPNEHLDTIRSVHNAPGWELRTDVERPLETAAEAVRLLGDSDYASWADAGMVVHLLSSMATEHPAGLLRVESLETLAKMGPWTFDAEEDPGYSASEAQVIDALKIIRDAAGRDDSDAALTARVVEATRNIAAYRFDQGIEFRERASLRSVSRTYRSHLRNARGVLMAYTGSTLDGFRGDAEVHEWMDRGYVALTGSSIRLALFAAATGDESELVRQAAVRQIGLVQPTGGAETTARLLSGDIRASVRREAAIAMGRFPLDVSADALISALADDMRDVRGAAARTLAQAAGVDFGEDRAAWRRWLQTRAAAGGDVAPPTDAGSEPAEAPTSSGR